METFKVVETLSLIHICVPLSKKLMDAMYPVMVSNIACGMNLSFTWQMYASVSYTHLS